MKRNISFTIIICLLLTINFSFAGEAPLEEKIMRVKNIMIRTGVSSSDASIGHYSQWQHTGFILEVEQYQSYPIEIKYVWVNITGNCSGKAAPIYDSQKRILIVHFCHDRYNNLLDLFNNYDCKKLILIRYHERKTGDDIVKTVYIDIHK